jgi:hypothetical protein
MLFDVVNDRIRSLIRSCRLALIFGQSEECSDLVDPQALGNIERLDVGHDFLRNLYNFLAPDSRQHLDSTCWVWEYLRLFRSPHGSRELLSSN